MPLKRLESLDSELKSIDAEYVNVNVPKHSEQAKEIRDMRKEGVSLESVKGTAE
jgi:hypothetical protein